MSWHESKIEEIGPQSPLRVTLREGNPNAVLSDQQFVIYNHFNSASSIQNVSDEQRVELYYGPDDQRRKAMYFEGFGENEEWEKTRYYIGAYEKQVYPDNNKIEVHYISAGGMLVAMYVIENDIGKFYYPHQDHLGSIIHVTDENAEIVYTQSFDAWGRTRNSDDLSYEDITERPNWLWRGYTGHEHLDEFGLINMNGRLYDPVIGRMLSPDNYIQSPSFSQSYNRYSYVWNNPLKYTDPSGELVFVMPHIGLSTTGSLDIGISVGVGFPNGLSAQVTVGHTFGNGGNTYAIASVSAAGATVYAGYSSQAGWMAGVGYGIGPGLGGFTTNATSIGVQWSQKGGFSANTSIFSYNQHGGFSTQLSVGYSHGFEFNRIPIKEPALYASTALYDLPEFEVVDYRFQMVIKPNRWTNFQTAVGMTILWATGKRLPYNFGSYHNNNSVANAMRNAWRVNEAREYFYEKYDGIDDLTGASVTNYKGDFGLEGYIRAGIDPIEQFIGSYRIDIHAIDGMLQYTLTNTSSFKSLTYGIGPAWEGGPMGNFKQTYIFTEPIR